MKGDAAEARAGSETRQDADRLAYLYSATVFGLALLVLIYVGQYMEIVQVQLEISRHEQETSRDQERTERLLVRRAELARLGRLEFAAQERLGLVLPGQGNVRYLPVAQVADPGGTGETLMLVRSPGETGGTRTGGGR